MTHMLLTRPLVSYPVEAVRRAGIRRIIVVVGYAADKVIAALGDGYEYVEQAELLGTGHALQQARPALDGFRGDLVVTVGDAPLLTPDVIRRLILHRRETAAAATLLTAVFNDQIPPYGRVVRESDGQVLRIVEERDATEEERQIHEVNASVYCFEAATVLPLLDEINNQNRAGEYYLTDIVEILRRHGHQVRAVVSDDPRTVLGVNTRSDMAAVSRAMRNRTLRVKR
jgi:bifunctional UDP-N-acetylglucosamine pyrophosphorylase/glucosamine-1-phosphate N-acetyltransferase